MKKIYLFLILLSTIKSIAQVQPTVTLDMDVTRPMPPNVVGFNVANIIQPGESLGDTCIIESLPRTDASEVRYPAGATGGFWNWQRGWFEFKDYLKTKVENWTLPSRYDGEPLANTLSDYKNATDSTVSSLLFNMNLLTSDYEFQRAGVFAAKGYNLKVSGLELGNELYYGLAKHPEFTFRYPTTKAYADTCKAWAAKLKLVFPGIPIAALGAIPEDGDEARIINWLPELLQNIGSDVKNITLHKYTGSGLPVGSNIDTASVAELNGMFKQAFKGSFVLDTTLFAQIASAGKNVWMTEYNIFDRDRTVNGSWGHGLFVGILTLSFLEKPAVAKVDCHTLFGNGQFAAIFADNNGFDYGTGFNSPTVGFSSKACQLTAVGNALSLILPAIRNSTQSTKIKFSAPLPPGLAQGYKSIYGFKFDKPNGKDVIIMNLSDTSVNFTTNPIFTSIGGTYEMISGAPQHYIQGNALITAPTDSTLQKTTGTFTGLIGNLVTIKPYSIIRLSSITSVQIISTVDTVCNGSYATLRAYGKGPFSWTSNDGTLFPGFSEVIHVQKTISLPGAAPVIYTATGASASASKTINFYRKPTLEIRNGTNSITSTYICAGTSITLNALITNGNSANLNYAWTRSEDISNPSAQTVTITPKKLNNTYILYATDGVCWNLVDTVKIASRGLADAGEDKSICNGGSDTLQAEEPGLNYEWDISPYTSPALSTSASFVVTPAAGVSNYRLKVTTGMCTGYDYKTVTSNICCPGTSTILSMQPYTNISNMIVNGTPISAALNTSNNDNTKDTLSNYNGTIYFNGPFNINNTFTFINCPNLKFGENALVTVDNYNKLNLVNTTLSACTTKLWTGIQTPTTLTSIEISGNTVIKNALFGLETSQNAQLSIRNSYFKDNHRHVQLNGFTISYRDSIYGTSFLATTPLLAPKLNEITIQGVNIINCVDIGVGNSSKAPNTFNGCNEAGIRAYKSGLTAVNNKFSNMKYVVLPPNLAGAYQSPAPRASGIYADNNGGLIKIINIGGTNTSQANLFDSCGTNGVCIFGNLDTRIINNDFITFKKGIAIIDPVANININLNEFNSNYYINTTNAALYRECTAIDVSSVTQTSPNRFYITNNTITKCRLGAYVSNVNGLRANGNNITLSKPTTGTQSVHYGFNLLTCSNARIETNFITSDLVAFGQLTTAQRQGYQGVYLNTVSNSLLRDNDLTRFGNHVSILNNCNGTSVTCNRFYRGGTGGIYSSSAELLQTIKLTSATISDLGTTTSSANNEWNSDYSAINSAQNYRVVGNTLVTPPKYYILSADPLTKKPSPYLVLGQGLLTQPASLINTCNPGIPLIILDGGNVNENHNTDLAKDNELPDSVAAVETVLNYEPIYDSTNTALGYFADLAIYNLGIILVDSGFVDSIAFVSTFEGSDIANIMELNNALMNSDSAQAAFLCGDLQGTDIVMQNIKSMNIYLLKANDYVFTHADSVAIIAMAYQKVQTGGPGVVTARNWLGIYLNDVDLIATPKTSNNSNTDNNWSFSLHPNPSEGLLRIVNSENESMDVFIYNSQSKIVATKKGIDSGSTFDFKSLSNGIYSVQIVLENGKQKSLKWLVEK